MNVTKKIEKLEQSSVKLTVTVPQSDVAACYKETLAKHAKSIQLPGFRKGKVPVSVLESKYGEALKADCAGELIEKALGEVFDDLDKNDKENRPLPYAQPAMKDAPELDTEKDLTFNVTYDVMPAVKVDSFDGIEISEAQVSIGKDELDEELAKIQERNALVLDKKDDEIAADGDIATLTFFEVAEDETEIEGTKREDFTCTIGEKQNFYKFDKELIGMKKGETKEFTKKYTKTEKEESLAGTTKKLNVTITALKVKNLPELDDELAQDVNEKYKTLDDMKADIKKNLKVAAEKKVREMKSKDLIEKLVEKYPFDVPASLIAAENESRFRMMAQQFQTTPEQLEKMLASTGQSKADMLANIAGDTGSMLKGRIIVESLLQERTYEIDDVAVEKELERIAEEAGAPLEDVKKYYAEGNQKQYIIEDMKEQKLYDELFGKVKVTKGDKIKFADLFKQQ